MKDIAEQAKNLPAQEPVNELDILSRSVPSPKPKENIPIVDTPIKKPKKSKKKKEPIPETVIEPITSIEAPIVLEQLNEHLSRLESQINRVMEMVEENAGNNKKYPFPEGATATNHSSGQQIVFSRGQWWYLDAEK